LLSAKLEILLAGILAWVSRSIRPDIKTMKKIAGGVSLGERNIGIHEKAILGAKGQINYNNTVNIR
jgi:hypothetical protein